jgi:transposase
MPVRGLRQTLRGRPPFAPAYARYTRRLQAFVEDLSGRMTISDLAAITGLGWDTVKDIVKARLEKDCGHPRLKELKRLSIDEIYVGRRRKFYTLVIDLDSGRIVWVAHGRGGDSLRKFWRALRLRQSRIEAVSMDLSPADWSAVLEHLPEAAIVFDRCHITKLVNEKLDDLRRAMVREATGLMKQSVKGVRYLLLMRRDNVDESRLSPYISNIRQLQSGAASDQPVLPSLSSFNDGATSQNAPSSRWASSHKSASHLV